MLDFIVLGQIPGTNLQLNLFCTLSLYILLGLVVVWFIDKTLLLKLVPAKLQKTLHSKFARQRTTTK